MHKQTNKYYFKIINNYTDTLCKLYQFVVIGVNIVQALLTTKWGNDKCRYIIINKLFNKINNKTILL